MARRSGCISHTTLHEATLGSRLPTWITTEQFVLACGSDPRRWKTDWERAHRMVTRGSGPLPVVNPVDTQVTHTATETPAYDVADLPAPAQLSLAGHSARPSVLRRVGSQSAGWALIALVAAAAAMAVLLLVRPLLLDAPPVAAAAEMGGSGATSIEQVPEQLPAAATVSSSAGTACNALARTLTASAAGQDGFALEADPSVPDCSSVSPKERFTTVWKVRNTGTSAWTARRLERTDVARGAAACETAQRIDVPTVAPGQAVQVRVEVVAADHSGTCDIRWVMKDAASRVISPGQPPLAFKVVVAS
ncbi:NBR1-Ig-like domain-containing protein [Luteipulveratus mongoliensis]|uniref:NBR1-Ig-like domain-containing protein n=1 Tax=Luteipulveratus mongoliensis TaxID=571913 RepID=UPI000696158A|nr:NBR1-Ig-like domain-containing protein [Luteipulveratus mongoliensis]